jgi:hypothetical protein
MKMAHRLVPIEKASTAEAAEFVVRDETGSACIPTGRTQAVEGGWSVEVFSIDGHRMPPNGASGRSMFTVLAVKGEIVQLRDSVGYEFSVQRHTLDCGIVKAGHVLSGITRGPGQVSDVVNETQGERREFGSSQPEGLSWCPGVATGPGFVK